MTDTSESKKLDPIVDYADYVRDEVSLGIPTWDILDFDQFQKVRAQMSDKDTLLQALATPTVFGGLAGAAIKNPTLRMMANMGIDAVSREGIRIAEAVASKLSSGNPFIKVKREFGDTGGNSGTGAGGNGSAGNPFNPNRMNFNAKPIQVRLDTGIQSKGYGDFYPESRAGLNVLEITQIEFRVPSSASSELKSYFDTVITFNFQNDAQMRVNFNVNAISKFGAANLKNWMDRYARAYGKYVWYTSIINYCNEPLNQNAGMRALRSMMTPQLLDDLAQLENMLEGTPAPPKFRELLHFIFGAPFKVSNNPGSQIRMISPSVLQSVAIGTTVVLGALPSDDLQSAITDMFSMRDTTALIARVCPTWIPGRGNVPGGMDDCEVSPNWSTLWENLPYDVSTGSTNTYGPVVDGEEMDSLYGSSADTLDGAITALWNGYDSTVVSASNLDKFRPGTIVPYSSSGPSTTAGQTAYSNRISYKYNSSGQYQAFFLASVGTNQDSYMRCETHSVSTSNNATHSVIWPGREIINNINIASARQTCYQLYSKMFDMGMTKSFGSTGKSDRGSSRRRGKSKPRSPETSDDEV